MYLTFPVNQLFLYQTLGTESRDIEIPRPHLEAWRYRDIEFTAFVVVGCDLYGLVQKGPISVDITYTLVLLSQPVFTGTRIFEETCPPKVD